jgi:hypothetical protein
LATSPTGIINQIEPTTAVAPDRRHGVINRLIVGRWRIIQRLNKIGQNIAVARQRGTPAPQPLATQFRQARHQIGLSDNPRPIFSDHLGTITIGANPERIPPPGFPIDPHVKRISF